MARLLCIAVFAALAGHTAAVVVGTPIARVISLLGKLEAQIQNEGKKEAAEYDKFSCYCKDQADNTLYAIETSREKISVLEAQLAKLDADITELAGDKTKNIVGAIENLETLITEKEDAITAAETKRKTENDAFKKLAEELADAIKAIEDATKAIKDKKDGVKDGKMGFLQDQLLEVLSTSAPTDAQLALIQSLTEAPADPAKNHAYTYKSNDILGTLQTLLRQFKDKKLTANVEEKEKLFAFDELKQALTNEKNFADKDRIQKVSDLADLRTDHAAKTSDKDAETEAKEADDAFMKELTADCESKAAQWDQRSSTRSDELTAIAKALTQLKEGVGSNYGSNGLAAASFLQLRNTDSSVAVVAQALALVQGEADRLKSATLTGMVLKMTMGGGFDKVVKLIADLITKLEKEATDAADSKSQCDGDMKKAVEKRDKNKLKTESAGATIAMKNAEKNRLGGEVEKLSGEIAELQKSVLEATELRSSEKANNEVTLADAKEGKAAIDNAIQVLKDFYTGAALLQAPAAVDRNGKSVGDAPKLSYDGDYKGKQDASKGIIGILEVIQSDFQRTLTNTAADEEQAVTDFESFEKKSKTDIDDKTTLKGDKEDDIKSASAAITQAKDDLIDADKLMNAALEELEKVTAMCMTGEGTFAERKKQREDEIKALKGASKILEDWNEKARD